MIVYYISKLPNKRTVHNWKNELYMQLEHEINDFLIFHSTQVIKSRERKKRLTSNDNFLNYLPI